MPGPVRDDVARGRGNERRRTCRSGHRPPPALVSAAAVDRVADRGRRRSSAPPSRSRSRGRTEAPRKRRSDKAVDNFRKSHGASTAGFLRPPGGVYTFAGTGTEKLSLLATTQHWGPRIPVTVTEDTNSCWDFPRRLQHAPLAVDRSTAREGACSRRPGETTFQSFDFVAFKANDTNEVVCSPAIDRIRVDAKPGSSWHVACDGRSKTRGTKFHARGTDTFVGIEKLRVGGELVPAYHYSVDRDAEREPIRLRALRHVVLGPRRTSREDRPPCRS